MLALMLQHQCMSGCRDGPVKGKKRVMCERSNIGEVHVKEEKGLESVNESH